MAWHGSNDFGEKAPSAPVIKSPRPIAEVRELTKLALQVRIVTGSIFSRILFDIL